MQKSFDILTTRLKHRTVGPTTARTSQCTQSMFYKKDRQDQNIGRKDIDYTLLRETKQLTEGRIWAQYY